jgi:hypothetical protein
MLNIFSILSLTFPLASYTRSSPAYALLPQPALYVQHQLFQPALDVCVSFSLAIFPACALLSALASAAPYSPACTLRPAIALDLSSFRTYVSRSALNCLTSSPSLRLTFCVGFCHSIFPSIRLTFCVSFCPSIFPSLRLAFTSASAPPTHVVH